MATLQPTSNLSERRHRSRSPGIEKLRLQPADPRQRSRSRTPRPYTPDSPKRYESNESRSRKPPQSPTVEDAGLGDDGVQMRGKLEQKPMIIPTNGNVESPTVELPSDDTDSISSLGSDDERNLPKPAGPGLDKRSATAAPSSVPTTATRQEMNGDMNKRRDHDAARGREQKPKLETAFSTGSSVADRPPRLERDRSPYSSGPRESRPKQNRFSSESLLSPTIQSPVLQVPGSPRSHSQRPPPLNHHYHDDGSRGSERGSTATRPHRPSFERRASAMADLGSPVSIKSPSHARKASGHYSSDESDNDASRYRARTAHFPTEGRSPLVPPEVNSRRVDEHRSGVWNTASPPRSPVHSDYPKSQGLNREALLNGAAAAASLHSLLDSHQRRASPRPSPQHSPTSSPYPSPPRTPPEPYRKRPISSSKDNSPTSRPTTPVLSGSTKVHSKHSHSDRMASSGDQDARAPRHAPRSRATSPLPPIRRPEIEMPKIDVRAPSPYAPQYAKSTSQEVSSPRTPSKYMPAYAVEAATLRPAQTLGRQRSYSSSDGQRPVGFISKPPVIHQSDFEYLSPTSENTPSFFRSSQNPATSVNPTTMERNARDSLATPAPASSNRSRSAIPTADQDPGTSLAVRPAPSSRPRARSSAPAPEIAYSDQQYPDPMKFPPCPNPKPMVGYREWYSIIGCDAFVICRDCRGRIFGQSYGRQFKQFDPPSATKGIQCAINDPWIRMACLASILKGGSDLTPVTNLAEENESTSPCPQRTPAQRDWYYLHDPEAEANLADFRVCSHCAYSIYSLFPVLDRCFKRADELEEGSFLCSLRSADPFRFGQYVSHCEKAQQAALKSGRKHPDMSDFIWYHKKETVISECTQDQVLIGRDWHQHPQIPECTVCEECYYEVIRPEIKKRRAIAQRFSPIAKHINDGVSCTLYSPRMKEVFRIACEDDDLKYLKNNVMIRRELQIEIMALKMAVQKDSRDVDAQEGLERCLKKWEKLEKEKYAEE